MRTPLLCLTCATCLVIGLAQIRAAPALTPKETAGLWADLASDDAGRAYRAIWSLALHPKEGLPLLRARLKPAAAPDPKRVARWIAELDDADFQTRRRARAELDRVVPMIEAELRQVLASAPSAEVRRSLQELLKGRRPPLVGRKLRGLRGIEALEYMGGPDATALLHEFAKGAPGAPETRAAKESLGRLLTRTWR